MHIHYPLTSRVCTPLRGRRIVITRIPAIDAQLALWFGGTLWTGQHSRNAERRCTGIHGQFAALSDADLLIHHPEGNADVFLIVRNNAPSLTVSAASISHRMEFRDADCQFGSTRKATVPIQGFPAQSNQTNYEDHEGGMWNGFE
ncbi:hypothetical protein [Cognatiyoonia koreensis]|uniref:hypothetical protein n=1 Tax=Cognatiyoonia koreensis TaxID=364200 RepID=UPI0010420DF3|nr:hypothetical protein [Cognatiyoonia koreensis]